MATTYTSPPVSHRRSLWFPSTPPSSSSETLDVEYDPPPRSYRHSVMSLRARFQDLDFDRGIRAMSLHKTSSLAQLRPPKTSNPASTNPARKPGNAHGGMLGSIRGRFVRKRPSEPLLSSSGSDHSDSLLESPTTPTGPGVPKVSIPSASEEGLYEDWSPYPDSNDIPANFQDERKMTAVPHTIVNGIGVGLQSPEIAFPGDRRESIDVDVTSPGYRKLDWFAWRDGMKVHPYKKEQAPYMQAYDRMLLDNDAFTRLLLKRLSNGAPSFHDYGLKPPVNVLDLGCGQGSWVVDAAAAWKAAGTKVTGLDLVDVIDEDLRDHVNVTWKRGNFVAYELPFPSNSFDLVRLANLTLCIPYGRWGHVLTEVKRVLMPGGRVELVDDHMFFPYVKPYPGPEARSSWSGSERSHLSQGSSTAVDTNSVSSSRFDVESDSENGSDMQPGLYAGDSPSDTDCEDLLTPTEGGLDIPPFVGPEGKERDATTYPPTPPEADPSHESRDLEQVFEAMLTSSFGIHTCPHHFLKELLKHIFGLEGNARKSHSFHLSLPGPDQNISVTTIEKGGNHPEKVQDVKKRMDQTLVEWDSRERERTLRTGEELLAEAQSLGKLTPKAAKLLGVDLANDESLVQPQSGNTVAASSPKPVDAPPSAVRPALARSASASSGVLLPIKTQMPSSAASSSKPKPYQPPGLVQHPDIFIPMTPTELEMHICKHIHVLLGCKVALADHIASITDDRGERFMSEDEWEDLMWRYECFRRSRFNLPDLLNMDEDSDDPTPITPMAAQLRRSLTAASRRIRSGSVSKDAASSSSGTPVRAIRVFEAYKVTDA